MGCCISPGPWRRKPPGPTETMRGCGGGGGASAPAAGAGGAGCGAGAGFASTGTAGLGCGRAVRGSSLALTLGSGLGGGGALRACAAAAGRAAASAAFTGEGRACRPRRCAFPITALRLTPPSSSAIWLAVMPRSHICLRWSMRSSVQDILVPLICWRPYGHGPVKVKSLRAFWALCAPFCHRIAGCRSRHDRLGRGTWLTNSRR